MSLLSGFGKGPQGILRKPTYTLSLIFKTAFGIFLATLVYLKTVKYEMPGNFQLKENSDSKL
jgi:hypothetical protein